MTRKSILNNQKDVELYGSEEQPRTSMSQVLGNGNYIDQSTHIHIENQSGPKGSGCIEGIKAGAELIGAAAALGAIIYQFCEDDD